MTASGKAYDPKRYARLLMRTLPAVIESAEDHERMLSEIERLIDKGDENLSPEEGRILRLMVRLVQDYEDTNHPIEDAAPHEVLRHLMEARGLKQADLVPIFGSSGYTSDVVNGKRGISKAHAKELAEFFHVTPDMFL